MLTEDGGGKGELSIISNCGIISQQFPEELTSKTELVGFTYLENVEHHRIQTFQN